MRRVILRIGFPKTGSTAIQNMFHGHRKELLETERLLYPGLSANLTTPLCVLFLDDPMEHNMVKLAGWSTNEVEERQRHYRPRSTERCLPLLGRHCCCCRRKG